MDYSFHDFAPDPDFSKNGLVALKCDPENTWITSSAVMLTSMIEFKNYLINKEFAKVETMVSYVGKMEFLARAIWSKNTGQLSPIGLIVYTK
jgi:hypothetical protein